MVQNIEIAQVNIRIMFPQNQAASNLPPKTAREKTPKNSGVCIFAGHIWILIFNLCRNDRGGEVAKQRRQRKKRAAINLQEFCSGCLCEDLIRLQNDVLVKPKNGV
jgi:hypothetical protein